MPDKAYLVLPLIAAILYSISALVLKGSISAGVGPWRTTFVVNVLMAFVFIPMVWGAGDLLHLPWFQALVCGSLFFIAQIVFFTAITQGDISVSSPVLGVKVILVAVFVAGIVQQTLPWNLWVAASLSTGAIGLMNWSGASQPGRVRVTILLTILAASLYAMTDALMQLWAAEHGARRLLPPVFWINGLLSFLLIPFFHAPLQAIPREAWKWLLFGAILTAGQCLILSWAFSNFNDAVGCNIVYSSRGLWSILLIWFAGSWFGNSEREAGHGVMSLRLAGALLLCSAIALTLI